MYHEIALGAAKPMTDERRQLVFEIAASVAEGLRAAAARGNIRQTADFVNGMMFGGLLLEKRAGGEAPEFVEALRRVTKEARHIIEKRGFRNADFVLASMARHTIGVSDMSPSDMLITMGLSAEGVIAEIGEEYGLTPNECVDVAIIVMTLAIMATAKEASLDRAFSALIDSAEEKAVVWDNIVPSDDEIAGRDPH